MSYYNLFVFCFVLLLYVVLVSLHCDKSVWKKIKRGRNLFKKAFQISKEIVELHQT